MNFPTAAHYAETTGRLIARKTWSTDDVPTQWLSFELGAWYLITDSVRRIVLADDLTEADFRGQDWHFPASCGDVETVPLPDYGGSSQAAAPVFSVANPPCKVA